MPLSDYNCSHDNDNEMEIMNEMEERSRGCVGVLIFGATIAILILGSALL
jgi:hypothetical protein